jgi:hypothetical protein
MENNKIVRNLNGLENHALKAVTYGLNLARPLAEKVALNVGNTNISVSDAGSSIVPIYFTGLEILGAMSPEIRGSSLYRSSKLSGAIGYGISTSINAMRFLNGDNDSGVKAALDFGMFYQLCKDSIKDYNGTGDNFFRDIGTVGKNLAGSVKNLFK